MTFAEFVLTTHYTRAHGDLTQFWLKISLTLANSTALGDANMLLREPVQEVGFGYTNTAHLLCNRREQTNQGDANYD
ncbi:hypothetical protein [Chroococcidiopsis sp. CCMEE 29]|uniref:hypothetical protein n=1 Tax=Chroococcidiopsis sp. CCMEE 29 TaxID=155894 RepID=UPI0020201C82|nr:hypothetical protein [Chroococcidiopsis sp. CCMEE 29]